MTDRLGELLREVDRMTIRPPGAPITLAGLAARGRRKRARAITWLMLAVLLPAVSIVLALTRRPAVIASRDPGIAHWMRALRARAVDEQVRELVSVQRAARAREGAAIAATLYAERLRTNDPARGTSLLRQVVAALPDTHGARAAARHLVVALPAELPYRKPH